MTQVIKLKNGKCEIMFDERDFAYLIEEHMGHEAAEYFRGLMEELERYREEDEDNTEDFIGKTLIDVELTDKALNTQKVEDSGYYEDGGGIQFVNFKFSDGSVLQFAVYNAHNGYYGHPIIIAKDTEILMEDTL